MKIMIVTDAWLPQTNGVVRTLQATRAELERAGHKVLIVGPDVNSWSSFKMPGYAEITLEFFAFRRLWVLYRRFKPDYIHIATEGPLGWAMRSFCRLARKPFTTAYHTRFPQYIAARVPPFMSEAAEAAATCVLRSFHGASYAVMVSTPTIEADLEARGFKNIVRWTRGVDTDQFRLWGKDYPAYRDLPRPISLYVGRVAVEKNIEAFLNLTIDGTKVVVGDGPDRARLEAQYPGVVFLGKLEKHNLAHAFSGADLFVFPSLTDTFGLVLLEACASGLRVAAYPVAGPGDVFAEPEAKAFAALDEDLDRAARAALALPDDPALPRAFAEKHSWAASADQFYHNLRRAKRIGPRKKWLRLPRLWGEPTSGLHVSD